jgi:hypothetical protein
MRKRYILILDTNRKGIFLMTNKQAKSGIIYQGKSLIDNEPIVVIATYSPRNIKTGEMVQTWILRADFTPLEASKLGLDYSICGGCKHKGIPNADPNAKQAKERSCYVILGQAPTVVYKAFLNGSYNDMTGHDKTSELGRGRMVRLGSYGDPSAVPSYVWDSLLENSIGHTGYTHQTNIASADVRPDLCMISADSEAQARDAWAQGSRTFRIISDYSELVTDKEIACPSQTKGIQCEACKLCMGASMAKSIAVIKHGNGAKYV